MMIPNRAARPIPAMIATGVARISGHGVAITKTAYPNNGLRVSRMVVATNMKVIGVNQTPKRSAIRWVSALFSWAS